MLYQFQDGKERVIAYASRSLKPSEKNYPAHKLEFLALKWAVSEKFHDYLYGGTFEVITDNPLTYVLTTAKLDATGQRWVASLSDYNFLVKYRSENKNADADGLSRRQEFDERESTIFPEVLKAVSHSLSVIGAECPLVESLAVSELPASAPDIIPEQLLQAHGLTTEDWRKAHLDDPSLHFIISQVQEGSRVPATRTLDPAFNKGI